MGDKITAADTLTPEQQKHCESAKWIIGGPRGTGRTRTLAAALIDESLNSGEFIRLIDHTVFNGQNYVFELIYAVNSIGEILKKHVKVTVKRNSQAAYVKAERIS